MVVVRRAASRLARRPRAVASTLLLPLLLPLLLLLRARSGGRARAQGPPHLRHQRRHAAGVLGAQQQAATRVVRVGGQAVQQGLQQARRHGDAEPGAKVVQHGVRPAAADTAPVGIHGGRCAGTSCREPAGATTVDDDDDDRRATSDDDDD